MPELRRCSKCILPETHETIMFDERGVCNICRQHEYKQDVLDWDERKRDLDKLISTHRNIHDYDCIIPFSGGKDSTWTVYYLVKEYGIKPLVVRFDHGFFRPKLHENTSRTLRMLGVDFIQFTPNWKVVRKLMLQSLLEKGDFCWHCHTGVVAYPMWEAIRHNVPLIFWGESPAEYTAYYSYDQKHEMDEKHFNRITNLGITAEDMFVRLEGRVDERDLKPFLFPSLKELQKIGCKSVHLGTYIPWDVKMQSEIIQKELHWQGDEVEGVPPDYEYEKIECYFQGVRDYIKYVKRGYSRVSHLTSLDIRNHRMDRDRALEIVKKYEGKRPASLDIFLRLLGLTKDEFLEIAMSHMVSPYVHDPMASGRGNELHDYARCNQYGEMPREETEIQLNRRTRHNKM